MPDTERRIRGMFTLCPLQIVMCDNAGPLSSGTAFFYEHEGESFLITNWHNFTFRHFVDKTPMNRSGRFPEHLKIKFVTAHEDGIRATAVAHRTEIYDADGPRWYEHPALGSGCDLVALPLARPDTCPPSAHRPANKLDSGRVPVKPGVTAFIVGFPRTISAGPGLPILKSGYIASETDFDVSIGGKIADVGGLSGGLTIPAFFIDSQTREGMSGAPVFAFFTGIWNPADPYTTTDDSGNLLLTDDTAFGSGMEFVGCYSGRVGPNEQGAALGLCWRTGAIEAICAARKPGQDLR